MKKIQLTCYDTSGRLVFIRFLEEFEDTKKTFRNPLTISPVRNSLTVEKFNFNGIF